MRIISFLGLCLFATPLLAQHAPDLRPGSEVRIASPLAYADRTPFIQGRLTWHRGDTLGIAIRGTGRPTVTQAYAIQPSDRLEVRQESKAAGFIGMAVGAVVGTAVGLAVAGHQVCDSFAPCPEQLFLPGAIGFAGMMLGGVVGYYVISPPKWVVVTSR